MEIEEIVEFLERNLDSASEDKENIIMFNHKKGKIIELVQQGYELKKQEELRKYVIVLERSDGNDTVGDMWLETYICNSKTTIEEIIEWKNIHHGVNGGKGKLIITEPSKFAKIKIIK